MNKKSDTENSRSYISTITPFNSNMIHKVNPWIPAWWSAAFPGLGHMILGQQLKGFILFFWEITINLYSNLNLSILYSFTGEFEMVKEVLHTRLLLLYMPIYIAGVWDSYHLSVDINKAYPLVKKEKAPIPSFALSSTGLNFLDKKKPIAAIIWSFFSPGLGHIYIKQLTTGVFLLIWFIIIIYKSKIILAMYPLFLGNIAHATAILDLQWMLFMPSLYGFALYDSYRLVIHNNQLYKEEQAQFLQKNYQDTNFTISIDKVR